MYNVLGQNNKNVLNKIGYYFYDTNGDVLRNFLLEKKHKIRVAFDGCKEE